MSGSVHDAVIQASTFSDIVDDSIPKIGTMLTALVSFFAVLLLVFFLASRARWLVVHTDLPAEEDRVTPHCWPIVSELKPHHRKELLRAGEGMAAWLTASWGPWKNVEFSSANAKISPARDLCASAPAPAPIRARCLARSKESYEAGPKTGDF